MVRVRGENDFLRVPLKWEITLKKKLIEAPTP
jgi:hypothetical protein